MHNNCLQRSQKCTRVVTIPRVYKGIFTILVLLPCRRNIFKLWKLIIDRVTRVYKLIVLKLTNELLSVILHNIFL